MVYPLGRSIAVLLYLCVVMMGIAQAAPHKISSISEDSFYDPPAGFEKLAPGKILRSRQLDSKSLSAFFLPQNVKHAYQFLYRTTDSLGKPITTATTLIVPHNADSSKLVSYQVMMDSPSPSCAPSYVLKTGAGLKGMITQAELLFMDSLLERGWYVVTGDYEGSKAAFTAGAMAGHGVLDSIRAVLSSGNQTQLQTDAQVQIWGYSGGALASGWALQLQPSYAPELSKRIIGAALGGLPVDLNQTLNAVSGGPFAGLAPSGIVGLSNQYPELAKYVDSIIKPAKKKAFYKVKDLCLTRLVLNYAFQKMDDYVTVPDYTNAPVAREALEANVLGRGDTPTVPSIFSYHAKHDQVVPYSPAADLYKKWCKNGASIEFVKDEASEHIILFVTGAANAIMYLEDRFKGEALHAGCSARTTITSLLDPGALRVFGKAVLDALLALLGGPLGPGHL